MPVVPKPYVVGYPVNFEPQGDTTTEAFHKHIQEIERIYGILRVLDEGQMDADDIRSLVSGEITNAINAHKNETNPHPNWKPSLSFGDISGSLDLSRTTGNLDASRVVGRLTNATIHNGNVIGLSEFIDGKLSGLSSGNGDGIVKNSLNKNGYVEFNNGFIIQWGSIGDDGYQNSSVYYPIAFPTEVLNIISAPGEASIADVNKKTMFVYSRKNTTATTGAYIAIGH